MRISTGRSQLRLMTGRLWWQLRIITKGHGDKKGDHQIDALSPKDNSSAHAHTVIPEPGKFTSNSFVSNSFGELCGIAG
jgi:hypothetical protein